MKINKLQIKGYKNLKDKTLTELELTNCDKYVALIGLNGSGKSNYIEAISFIFLNLKIGEKTDFEYLLDYDINGENVVVENDNVKVNIRKVAKARIAEYLPSNVIASYSGEELRMWEDIYQESYSDFFQDVKKHNNEVPFLLYINKYSWAFALISLLCSEKPHIQYFISEVLGIGDEVEIQFEINEDNYGMYENNDALSLIKRIVDLQNNSANGRVHINEIRTLDIGQKDNSEYTKLLFYYLFITGMPVRNEKIKAERIIRKTELFFNGIDLPKLSEGEKKLILIYSITNLLSDENTLLLLDEPDAHVHIERKKEIVDIITEAECFSIFSTHSPKILHYIKDESIRIIRNGEKGLEVIQREKLDALADITNGEFSIVDATIAISSKKPLLLVEGKGDVAHILNAINLLSNKNEIDIDILPFGGAGNAKEFIDELLKCVPKNKKIIVLFDRDDAGFGSDKGGMKSCINFSGGRNNNNTYKKGNCIYLMLPKTATHTETDFLIEDYFTNEKKTATAALLIANANGAFNSFPKDLKQKMKEELARNISTYMDVDLAGFQILIDKLKSIIDGTEILHEEEKVAQKKLVKEKAIDKEATAKTTVPKKKLSLNEIPKPQLKKQ